MDNRDENAFSAALVVDQMLDETQGDWQHYAKLRTDAGALKTAIGGVNTASKRLKAAIDAGGQIDAKEAAETRALDAAMVVVTAAASSVVDTPNEVLRGIGQWARWELVKLRDTDQLTQLEAIYEQAHPHRAELVDDLVTDAHFAELQAATAALKPFVNKARGEVVTAAGLRREEQKALAEMRRVLQRLDKRMDVLSHQNKALADRYFQARMIVDLGGGGGKKDEGAE